MLFALAAAAYYGLPAGHLRIHVAGALLLLLGLTACLTLGALTFGRNPSPWIMAGVYCLLALPLFAAIVLALFALAWSAAHLSA